MTAQPPVNAPENEIDSSAEFASLDATLQDAVRARKPGDALSMEESARSYNFKTMSDRRTVLTRQIIRECMRARAKGETVRVMDVGCGRGMERDERYVAAIKRWADEMWGVEPDESVAPPASIFDHVRHALLEDADLPENHFDVAFSYMVMEHVADPERFYTALARTLKPGGVYVFLTPNKAHYFSICTRILMALRLEEIVLRILRGKVSEEYHYPVVYKCNDRKQIERYALTSGFSRVDIACFEITGPRPYLKGPLRPILWAMEWKRRHFRKPHLLLNLMARLTKAGS